MDGLKHLFFRLIPITMLICFVCFGINYIFNVEGSTYLTYTYTNNGIKIYQFNFTEYMQNLNIDIIKRATTNVIDTTTFHNLITSWETIWSNGYNFGDILATIANGFIILADAIIVLINIPLILLRIASGILLTGLSIIGININSTGITIRSLHALLDNAVIPYIQPVIPA